MSLEWISDDEWATIVRNVPIVSVDLVVQSADGLILGKRRNEPAKGEWFVPGGRIHKYERLTEAVHRLAHEELGIDEITIQQSLGVYEHIYEASNIADSDGKHYLANGFVVKTDAVISEITHDDQHSDVRAFDPSNLPADLHEYTAAYLRDADAVVYPVDEHV
jgi:colanic acid biosynthesis protein WcaH